MGFWIGVILGTIFLIAGMAAFGMKLLFPRHRILALWLYVMSGISFIFSVSRNREWVASQQEYIGSFLATYSAYIVPVLLLLLVGYITLSIFPITKSSFKGLSKGKIWGILVSDENLISYYDLRLKQLYKNAKDQGVLDIDFARISLDQKELLQEFWWSYTEILFDLDLLKERYESCYCLNPFTKFRLHKKAFLNGYAATVVQKFHAIKITESVKDVNKISFFNDLVVEGGVEQGTFGLLQSKAVEPSESIRLMASRLYYKILGAHPSPLTRLIEKYADHFGMAVKKYLRLISKSPMRLLEKKSSKFWFPIQKFSAEQLPHIRAVSRDYHITPEQINSHRDKLIPGDIMLERREWQATNIGIPGFWTHTAMYIGSLEEMDIYFSDLTALEGKSASEYIKDEYPDAYRKLQQQDEDGYAYSVIEAKAAGVILMSLEKSTNAYSLAVLRVKDLLKLERFKVVMRSLGYLGVPYDFDFNFVTDSAFVCSELVFKSYQNIKQLSITPEELNGRLIFATNQFAEKYTKELKEGNSELDLILFLDGDEKKGVATEKTSEEFMQSRLRPKWYALRTLVK